jgi:hypothetical protein
MAFPASAAVTVGLLTPAAVADSAQRLLDVVAVAIGREAGHEPGAPGDQREPVRAVHVLANRV